MVIAYPSTKLKILDCIIYLYDSFKCCNRKEEHFLLIIKKHTKILINK